MRLLLAVIYLKACNADCGAGDAESGEVCTAALDATKADVIMQKKETLSNIHVQENDVGAGSSSLSQPDALYELYKASYGCAGSFLVGRTLDGCAIECTNFFVHLANGGGNCKCCTDDNFFLAPAYGSSVYKSNANGVRACKGKAEGHVCSLDPFAQVWEGPFAATTDMGGVLFHATLERDVNECQETCQDNSKCKAIKYTNQAADDVVGTKLTPVEYEATNGDKKNTKGKNCFLLKEQQDDSSCRGCSSQLWKKHGQSSSQVQCVFWGDPHFDKNFVVGRGYFDFMRIGLYELARSKDGKTVVQDFQCSYNNDGGLSVAVGIVIFMDGRKTPILGQRSNIGDEISVGSVDSRVKLKVNIEATGPDPGFALRMDLTMDKSMDAGKGVCGMSDLTDVKQVAVEGNGLFTQDQIDDMCKKCLGSHRPAICAQSQAKKNEAKALEQSPQNIKVGEELCTEQQKRPARERCCWLVDDDAYKACVTDVCGGPDGADVIAGEKVAAKISPQRTCQSTLVAPVNPRLECLPPWSSRCIDLESRGMIGGRGR